MLEFFRKYQRYFFSVITVVIVISFSFFGTYSAISNANYHEQIAFTAVDGTQIKRSELDQMALFLGTDAEDKLLFGGIWGPNFLNDGVMKKDFLQNGLAEVIAIEYKDLLKQDLDARGEKEKRFTLYTHPQAQFLSVAAIWSYAAPQMKAQFDALRSNQDFAASQAFTERVNLYLSERNLPAPTLRQILLYQQRQYSWLIPDPNLDRMDLSLFGYHTIEDWFGPRFLRLAAEYVINSAKIAEKQGYRVSKEEALAELIANSENSYKQNLKNPYIGVATSGEYFNEQLNRMGLDQNKAVAIWRQVMLFRRLFHDMGQSVFVDPQTFAAVNDYNLEMIEGAVYRLPQALRFSGMRDLQKFQYYLAAVSKPSGADKDSLILPTAFSTPSEVAKHHPELVQKRYVLEISRADKNRLSAKVTLKDTWKWEIESANWDKLKKQFADIGTKKGDTPEERLAVLDALDDRTRDKIDAFARKEIVEAHPEWVDQALDESESKQSAVSIRLKGGKTPFEGLEDHEAFIRLLDHAKIGESDPKLAKWTANHSAYYRVKVLERTPDFEVMTFAEAQKNGALDPLVDKNPPDLAGLLKEIHKDYAAAIAPKKAPENLIDDVTASLRLYSYMRKVHDNLAKNPDNEKKYLQPVMEKPSNSQLTPAEPLADQWKLEKSSYFVRRNRQTEDPIASEAFKLEAGSWTKVSTPVNGDLAFFHLAGKSTDATPMALQLKVDKVRKVLGMDSMKMMGRRLLSEMKAKDALSLKYLEVKFEENES